MSITPYHPDPECSDCHGTGQVPAYPGAISEQLPCSRCKDRECPSCEVVLPTHEPDCVANRSIALTNDQLIDEAIRTLGKLHATAIERMRARLSSYEAAEREQAEIARKIQEAIDDPSGPTPEMIEFFAKYGSSVTRDEPKASREDATVSELRSLLKRCLETGDIHHEPGYGLSEYWSGGGMAPCDDDCLKCALKRSLGVETDDD